MTFNRRAFLQGSGAALSGTALASGVPSMGFAQSPGRTMVMNDSKTWMIGDIRCTALFDGIVQVDAAIFDTAEPEAFAMLMEQTHQPQGKINLDVNAYLLEIGTQKLLIDTGTRDLYGPTLGRLPDQLAAIGVSADHIDKVVLTHMHNDHTGGLTSATGSAVFTNAELIVPAAEWDFWTNEAIYANASDGFRFSFTGARAAAAAYAGKVRVFGARDEVLPGLSPISLPGHSIGHTGYRLSAGSDQMVIWGDCVVSPQVQFDHPEWASTFDADAASSIASRRRIFDETATDMILVAGMHLPFPGVGYLSRRGGRFRFDPAI
ncbi:MBL fold metallo-hydrolase [Pararhodobacter aggregans]|uniref:MBL fold metallo-hydrolase n=2 Tax=Pararhodobacter aggregans TaxID=404875 RepID=A0A2T7UM50_9RHOB|nr:MBL fold metallo-hydrolase [Pararhodobacter aggregans]PTW99981.1 glyoxylase-like metal-dependent hydrolase (beta-lactamase superfamily II) [Pararhodobacter aggregans]PVE45737.1 MBL fold metallo-hydrolase [Pararhodobacter aggregans]